ncbi:MAG: coproporphyrinogen III oxidase [Flavobacteriales bacterium]|nr:coproporphyrinogen III oxidase [Flavobacteriales bacterium]
MAGIYIHIPYCKKKCVYCDFYFKINTDDMHEMINCIIKELVRRKKYVKTSRINTIYFGGGTPSILTEKEIKKILSTIYDNYKVCEKPEITLEANPDDLNMKKIANFFNVGVNRLSIGVQSFNDDDLIFLNRNHSREDAISSIKTAQKIGFKNISADLMYGLPNQSLNDWEDNLNLLFDLNIQHLSAYMLTLEKKTKLFEYVKKNKVKMTDDTTVINQYYSLLNIAKKNNFVQYEISNFAKDNVFSKHNTSYWQNKLFLGIGPSAHSFNYESRRWNIASNKKYIEKLNTNNIYFEEEILTINQQYNEYVLTNLRTMWGININVIKSRFGSKFASHTIKMMQKWNEKKYIHESNENVVLTDKGSVFADKIISDLFFVENL